MKVKITKPAGAFPDSEGRLVAPGVGDEVEVKSEIGRSLVAAGLAEAAGVAARAKAAATPKKRQARPKESTVGEGPGEVR